MYNVSDLRKGLKIEIDGEPFEVTDFDFCKPGKGQALYRCKLKSMITGYTMDRTYRSDERFEKPDLIEREMQFSYCDGDEFVFMDPESYEQHHLPASLLGDKKFFLSENAECSILFFRDKPIEVTLPFHVEQKIVQADPGARGDTATNVTKPAKLESGYEVQVPIFVNQGDIIRIDTRTGAYVERVRKS